MTRTSGTYTYPSIVMEFRQMNAELRAERQRENRIIGAVLAILLPTATLLIGLLLT